MIHRSPGTNPRRWLTRALRAAAVALCLVTTGRVHAASGRADPAMRSTPVATDAHDGADGADVAGVAEGAGTDNTRIDVGAPLWEGVDPAERRDVLVVLAAPPVLDRLGPLPADVDFTALGFGRRATRAGRGAERERRVAAARTAAAAAVSAVAAEQAPLARRIHTLGMPVLSTYGTVANAFRVAALPDDIARLAALPGVATIIAAPNHRLQLADAVPHIGADRVAAALGFDGRGVTIGVIDTGIDYFHAAFGGPGTAAAYGGDDHTVVEAGTFPTAKVVGGYDFAGSQYTGSGPAMPDDDPVDENGHGTHVAGIAAANAWAGGHGGAAPGARLVALKVFGMNGSTNLAYDAIEWAVEAKLGLPVAGQAADIDVLNLSLGSAWASPAAASFEQRLIDRAVAAGIVVVGAAGNDGDVAFVTGGPGMARSAIGVASSVGPGQLGDRVQAVVDGAVEDIEALESHPSLAARMTMLGRLQGRAIWLGRGCDGDAVPAGVAGRVAVVQRGDCTFRMKVLRAAAAGAVAAVVVDNGGGLVPMGGDGTAAAIPAYMIGAAAGQRLRTALDAGAVVEMRFDGAFNGRFPRASLVDTVSSFSSRGMTRAGTFKPDLAAPGSAIRAPAIGSGNRSAALSGTSMAAPMIAGSAAVIIQALAADGHALGGNGSGRGITPHDVRTLLMSTAFTDVKRRDASDPAVAPFARRGAGRVALEAAVRTRTVLRALDGSGALSFGAQAAAAPWSGSVPFELRNLTDAPRRFALSVVASWTGEASDGIRFAVDVPVVTVGPEGTAAVRLLAAIVPQELEPYALRGGASAMNGDGRLEAAERDAYVVATELGDSGLPLEGGDVVRLPVWSFARGASDLVAAERATVAPGETVATIEIENSGAQPGRCEVFAHLATDPVEAAPARPFNAVEVGARVTGSGAARRIEIAVVFAAAALVPFDVAMAVSLDTNRDGAVDHVLTVDDASVVDAAAPVSGILQTVATDARGRGAVVVGAADVDVNNRLVVLQADAAALGYDVGTPIALDLAVETTARFSGSRVDGVPDGGVRNGRLAVPLTFDADAQPVTVGASTVMIDAGERAAVDVHIVDRASLDGFGLLLLYPDDAPGEGDAQVVTLQDAAPATPTAGAPTSSAVPGAPSTATAAASPAPTTPSASGTPTATVAAGPTAVASEAVPAPTSTPTPTPTPTPAEDDFATATSAPTAPGSDDPTRPPRQPTINLPVEPTATWTAEAPSEPTPTETAAVPGSTDPPSATRAPSTATATGGEPPSARAGPIYLPFAYRRIPRQRP